MKVIIISRLIIMTSIMLSMGLLANPIKTTTITPVFSQEEGSSVSIAPGAADPNNDLSFILLKSTCQQEALFLGQMMIQYNIL